VTAEGRQRAGHARHRLKLRMQSLRHVGARAGPQVPQGATPRSLTVHLRGELTRGAKPGDAVTVSGVFLPEPFTGFRAMRAGLLTSVFLQARARRPPAPTRGARGRDWRRQGRRQHPASIAAAASTANASGCLRVRRGGVERARSGPREPHAADRRGCCRRPPS